MPYNYHMEKKRHSSKQAVPITYTLDKRFDVAATFESL